MQWSAVHPSCLGWSLDKQVRKPVEGKLATVMFHCVGSGLPHAAHSRVNRTEVIIAATRSHRVCFHLYGCSYQTSATLHPTQGVHVVWSVLFDSTQGIKRFTSLSVVAGMGAGGRDYVFIPYPSWLVWWKQKIMFLSHYKCPGSPQLCSEKWITFSNPSSDIWSSCKNQQLTSNINFSS